MLRKGTSRTLHVECVVNSLHNYNNKKKNLSLENMTETLTNTWILHNEWCCVEKYSSRKCVPLMWWNKFSRSGQRQTNVRVTSPGERTVVRYRSLPTRESSLVNDFRKGYNMCTSIVLDRTDPRGKKTTFTTIWNVYHIWIVYRYTQPGSMLKNEDR